MDTVLRLDVPPRIEIPIKVDGRSACLVKGDRFSDGLRIGDQDRLSRRTMEAVNYRFPAAFDCFRFRVHTRHRCGASQHLHEWSQRGPSVSRSEEQTSELH